MPLRWYMTSPCGLSPLLGCNTCNLPPSSGSGKFGIVYRCTDKETGRQLAAKFVATPRKEDKRDVTREVEIMSYLQHPGIIQIFDAFDGGKEMTLVMEL